jgi:hypothetical protein
MQGCSTTLPIAELISATTTVFSNSVVKHCFHGTMTATTQPMRRDRQ